MGGRPLYHQQ